MGDLKALVPRAKALNAACKASITRSTDLHMAANHIENVLSAASSSAEERVEEEGEEEEKKRRDPLTAPDSWLRDLSHDATATLLPMLADSSSRLLSALQHRDFDTAFARQREVAQAVLAWQGSRAQAWAGLIRGMYYLWPEGQDIEGAMRWVATCVPDEPCRTEWMRELWERSQG